MSVFKEGHHLSLLQGSGAYFAALSSAMDAASEEVRLETYIFDFTASGQEVARSLIRAAERGVKVFLLVDGAGSEHLPAEWLARFDAAGVQWRIYKPLGRFGLLIPNRWRRLHRKLCVIDGGTPRAVGFCGGINILDDYFDPNYGTLIKPRFDFAVQAEGALVCDIFEATRNLWLRQSAFAQMRERVKISFGDALMPSPPGSDREGHSLATAALLLRDNVRNRRRIETAYLQAIKTATQEIIIANAYFLPGGKLRKALLAASARGVKVKLLLQGRYEYFMQFHAARPVYAALLAGGIEIHEYAASFLHAKVAVIDAFGANAWATVGSSNLDPLSLLLAREANLVVRDGAFARDLRERLCGAMKDGGKQVNSEDFANRPWQQRLLDAIAFGLMRLALLFTGKRY